MYSSERDVVACESTCECYLLAFIHASHFYSLRSALSKAPDKSTGMTELGITNIYVTQKTSGVKAKYKVVQCLTFVLSKGREAPICR